METSTDRINRRAHIEALPRVKFVCGVDWVRGHDVYRVGVFWRKDLDAGMGELAYSKWFTIVFRFRLWIDRSR